MSDVKPDAFSLVTCDIQYVPTLDSVVVCPRLLIPDAADRETAIDGRAIVLTRKQALELAEALCAAVEEVASSTASDDYQKMFQERYENKHKKKLRKNKVYH